MDINVIWGWIQEAVEANSFEKGIIRITTVNKKLRLKLCLYSTDKSLSKRYDLKKLTAN